MTKVRALRHGVMTEFEMIDEGEVNPGDFVMTVRVPGLPYYYSHTQMCVGVDLVDSRMADDARALRLLGFSGRLSMWDCGRWEDTFFDIDKVAPMTGISPAEPRKSPRLIRAAGYWSCSAREPLSPCWSLNISACSHDAD